MAKDGKVILACTECLSRNYTTNRKKNSSKRLELNKYCPKCGRKLRDGGCECLEEKYINPQFAVLQTLLDKKKED